MKKILMIITFIFLACAVCISAPFALKSKAATVDDLTFELNSDGASYTLTKCSTTASGSLNIPDSYNGLPITVIGEEAFYNCNAITAIKIPSGIASIGINTFSGCENLRLVAITDLTAWCNIDFDSSSANPLCYAKNLYLKGELVTEIEIPNSVTEVKDYAFYNCNSLTSVTIGDSVTSIGEDAFNGCDNLTNIVATATNASKVIAQCRSKSIKLELIGSFISDSAFSDCDSLTSVTIPDSVTSIGDKAFYNCKSLTSVTIPDSVTSISKYAFYNCYSLTSITIPDSVTSIGSYAFSDCDSLKSVAIGDSVTSIGEHAFWGCNSLTSVTIGDSVTSIGEGVFANCDSLTSVTIGDSVTSIGEGAFSGCDSLTSITIPDSVTSIGDIAFASCTALTSATIPDSVTSIGDYAFYNCTSLTSITVGDGVTSIGDEAFYNCTSLTSITIGDGVTSIGDEAFYNCYSLTSVNITDIAAWCNIAFGSASANPLYYAKNVYLKNKKVTELVIPEGVTEIKNYAFYNCTSLTSVTIPNSVTSIGEAAFVDCSALEYIFYSDSSEEWDKINIGKFNSKLTSAKIHYNTTGHSHSVVKTIPFFEGMEGTIEDVCPVCGYVHYNEKLIWVNEFIAAIDAKNVVIDATNNTLTLDISACKDINEAIIVMDGYTLTTTPNSSYGFIGTGSKLKVSTTTGTQVAEYTLVVRGDVNGDSVCDALDCMLVELARNKHITLDGVYFDAANLSEDTQIDTNDFNAVVNKALI